SDAGSGLDRRGEPRVSLVRRLQRSRHAGLGREHRRLPRRARAFGRQREPGCRVDARMAQRAGRDARAVGRARARAPARCGGASSGASRVSMTSAGGKRMRGAKTSIEPQTSIGAGASTHEPEVFRRHPDNPILTVDDLDYRANSVFNPAAAIVDGETILLLRVEDRRGFSHFTVARSADGIGGWRIDSKPTLEPSPATHPEEIWGIEDPRITYLDEQNRWVIAYTAFSRGGPLVSLAATDDFVRFERLGAVMTPEDKDAALFPERIQGRWALIHRPVPGGATSLGAHMWISFSPDLKHWGDHEILLRARQGGWWDANKIGLSPPP